MGLLLALLLTFSQGPAGIHERAVGAALSGPTRDAATACRRDTRPFVGANGFAWGRSDGALRRLAPSRKLACLSALVQPGARPGARRLARTLSGRPGAIAAFSTLAGWCRDDPAACAIDRCAAKAAPAARLACLFRLAPAAAARPRARDLAAAARVLAAPDDFDTLAQARVVFATLAAEGYPRALSNLALVEYRLTNLEAAYDAAMEGAAYGIPTARALAAYLIVEGIGPRRDLSLALDLAEAAAAAGSADGRAVLALDVSYLFSPRHWRDLQEALVAAGAFDGTPDGHFRGPWQDALAAFASDNALPEGVTLPLLDALGMLEHLTETLREQRTIRRY